MGLTLGRLMIDPPLDGAINMAVDQALLETADQTGLVTLRFYRWLRPTLTIGYFQNHLDRNQHKPSLDCPLIRRKSGGGAIVHDQELTYSLCVPCSNRLASRNTELYESVHEIIVELLEGSSDLTPSLFRNMKNQPSGDPAAFLCFQRRSSGDICVGDDKIVGSAQRRIRNSLLQHGSILWKRSEAAPSLPGIQDLCSLELDLGKFISDFKKKIESCLQIQFEDAKLSPLEKEVVSNCLTSTFLVDSWNLKR